MDRKKAKVNDDRLVRGSLRHARLLRSAEVEDAPLKEEDGIKKLLQKKRQFWYQDRMGDGVTK